MTILVQGIVGMRFDTIFICKQLIKWPCIESITGIVMQFDGILKLLHELLQMFDLVNYIHILPFFYDINLFTESFVPCYCFED